MAQRIHIETKSPESICDGIQRKLKSMGYKNAAADFGVIVMNDGIKGYLDDAEKETSENFMNKHGRVHGLVVAYRTLSLFELIHYDDIDSDYLDRKFLASKEELIFALLAASYIHDIGRFYDPEVKNHEAFVSLGIGIIRDLTDSKQILSRWVKSDPSKIHERIRDLCLCHDNKDIPSNTVEIALIKLADALDCSKERVYSIRAIDEFEKKKLVFFKDRYPEDYFGCLGINKVDVVYEHDEGVVDITLETTDNASAKPIKTLLRLLQNCKQRRTVATKDLAAHIQIYIKSPRVGNLELLYPEDSKETQRTPQAETDKHRYRINIEDLSGKTTIECVSTMKNLGPKGLRSRTVYGEGLKPTKWEEIEGHAFLLTNNGEEELEAPVHKRSTKNGKGHWYKIVLRKKGSGELMEFKMGDTCTIKRIFTWPAFLNVKHDEFFYTPVNPCESLEVEILFPKEIMKEKIKAGLQIRDGQGLLYSTPLESQLAAQSRVKIQIQLRDLRPPYIYAIVWCS